MEQFDQIPVNFLHRLKLLTLQCFDDEHINFPDWILQKLPALERLVVRHSLFVQGFPCVGSATSNELIETNHNLKNLMLFGLPKLEHICKGYRLPVLENLENLSVFECPNLVKLVPSSVFFNSLRYLEIKQCNGLKSLITLSTAKSLVHLSTLKILECSVIKEIVVNDGNKEGNEIEFRELYVLELQFLPSLQCFWSLDLALSCPRLSQVTVQGCPRMKTFIGAAVNAPELQKVQLDQHGNECSWEGDLNATIEKLFNTKDGDTIE